MRAAKNVNLGDYEEEPRMTRIRADKYERGDWPIRAYPRNLRLHFLTGDNRGNGDSAPSLFSLFAPVQFFVFYPRFIGVQSVAQFWLRPKAAPGSLWLITVAI